MTIAVTFAAFQALHATIAGLTAANCPSALPSSLNSADLPIVFPWPGEAEHNHQGNSLKRTRRLWIVRLWVKPIAQGEGPDEGFQAVLPFLDRFALAYITNTSLGGVVDHAWSDQDRIKDHGVLGDLEYGGTLYWGARWELMVTEKTA